MKQRGAAFYLRSLILGLTTKFDKVALACSLRCRNVSGYLGAYQPAHLGKSYTASAGGRFSADRFEAISKALPDTAGYSVLDIGCNEGYFTIRMAEQGNFAIGIDVSSLSIRNAQDIARHNDVSGAVFSTFLVEEQTVAMLPKVDVVICLSVYHHWARKLGEEGAFLIMQGLARKTEKYLVFETGQPNERNVDWADELNFMRPDHKSYIIKLLHRIGFDDVTPIGLFETTVSDVPRDLYLARKENG